jgi:hypothetical protein
MKPPRCNLRPLNRAEGLILEREATEWPPNIADGAVTLMQFASIKPGIGVLGYPFIGELVVAAASRVGGSGILGGIEDDLSVARDFLVALKGVIDTPRRKRSGLKAALRGSSVSPQLAAASPPYCRKKVSTRA